MARDVSSPSIKSPIRMKWVAGEAVIEYNEEPLAMAEIVPQQIHGSWLPQRRLKMVDVHALIEEEDPDAQRKFVVLYRFLMSPRVMRTFRSKGAHGYNCLTRNETILRYLIRRYPFEPSNGELLPASFVHRSLEEMRRELSRSHPERGVKVTHIPEKYANRPFVLLTLPFGFFERWRQSRPADRTRFLRVAQELLSAYTNKTISAHNIQRRIQLGLNGARTRRRKERKPSARTGRPRR